MLIFCGLGVYLFMQKKFIQLLVSFTLLFAFLLAVQAYLIYNTFSLRKSNLIAEVKGKLSNMEEQFDVFDDDAFDHKEQLSLYHKLEIGELKESDLQRIFQANAARSAGILSPSVDSVFMKAGLEVAVQKKISSIVGKKDNKELIQQPLLIYQTVNKLRKERPLTIGTWKTNSATVVEDGGQKSMQEYQFVIVRNSSFDILNLDAVVFKDMILLFVLTLILLSAVLFIYYKTYRNLLQQEREAQVLHDTVDNIAHEFRTPLATLKLTSSALRKAYSLQTLAILERQVLRLEQVLDPLHAGQEERASTYVDRQHVQELLADISTHLKNTHCVMDGAFQGHILIKTADFNVILSNLVENSAKYGAQRVWISLSVRDRLLLLIVKDDGIGIDKALHKRIFDKYFRVQENNIHTTKGLGLGLYLVKQKLQQYDADITVKSALGEGAQFEMILPYED